MFGIRREVDVEVDVEYVRVMCVSSLVHILKLQIIWRRCTIIYVIDDVTVSTSCDLLMQLSNFHFNSDMSLTVSPLHSSEQACVINFFIILSPTR